MGNNTYVLPKDIQGLLLAFLSVFVFSWTLPASKMAVGELGGWGLGLSRSLLAGSLALLVLLIRQVPFPARTHWKSLVVVALSAVGFAVSVAMAMRDVPSIHAAVVIAVIPVATSLIAVARMRERPTWRFWIGLAAGSSTVVLFLTTQTGTGMHIHQADLWLIASLLCSAITYVEGGKLASSMPGWQVISWMLVFTLPAILPMALYWWMHQPQPLHLGLQAWMAVLYVSVFSAYLGFFPWYHSFSLIGISRASSVQLLQPLLTFTWGALFLGEHLTQGILVAGFLVLGSSFLCWKR